MVDQESEVILKHILNQLSKIALKKKKEFHLTPFLTRMSMFRHILGVTIVTLMLIHKYLYVTPPQYTLLGPHDATENIHDPQDIYDQLIDLKNFTFKVNPQPCQNYSAGILLVVIVSSKPNHFENRITIRKTWGRSSDSTKLVFLLGESQNATVRENIHNESAIFEDIVQGNFIDAYWNMSYKFVMGLKWVSHHCGAAKYVLKTDDDVVVNSVGLRRFLARGLSPWGARELITCHVHINAPARRAGSKWNVTSAEYRQYYYPVYCAGWAVLFSQDVVPRLLKASQSVAFYRIDDVFVTGQLAEHIGVARTPLGELEVLSGEMAVQRMSRVEHAGIFGPKDISAKDISNIWKNLQIY